MSPRRSIAFIPVAVGALLAAVGTVERLSRTADGNECR